MKRVALIALVLVACGDGGTTTPVKPGPSSEAPAWVRGAVPPELADSLVAVGHGPSEAAAEADAVKQLDLQVWGEGVSPHSIPVAACERQAYASNDHAVLLALSKPTLARLMREHVQGITYVSDDPNASLNERLKTAAANYAKAVEKKRACVWTECTVDDTAQMRANLEQRARLLTLTSLQPHGVPYRRGVGALRPLAVSAMLQNGGRLADPAYGVSLRVLDAGGTPLGEPVRTASDGSARFDVSSLKDGSGRLRVVLDAPELGALDLTLPELTVPLREITSTNARIAIQLNVSVDEQRVSEAPAVAALSDAIAAKGLARPEPLAARFATILASPRETEFALRDIADLADGSIDIIVLGSMQTSFASRMGARSVWHQAKGTIAVYDVWTGTLVAEHARETQAVGLGDAAAQTKAITELARIFAQDVQADVAGLGGGGAMVRGPLGN